MTKTRSSTHDIGMSGNLCISPTGRCSLRVRPVYQKLQVELPFRATLLLYLGAPPRQLHE